MIITWAAQGKPHYVSEDGSIPYISDIGADILKPLFIVGCAITGVSFFLALVVERWLRHSGRYVYVIGVSPPAGSRLVASLAEHVCSVHSR